MKKIIIILFYVFIYCEALEVTKNSSLNLLPHVTLYEQTINGILTDEQIIQKSHLFKKPLPKETINYNFTNSTLWFKIDVKNAANFPIDKVIYINAPLYHGTTLYTLHEDTITKQYAHQLTSQFSNSIYPYFHINLKENETKTLYLKVKSDVFALNFSLFLFNEADVYRYEKYEQIFFALFLGTIIAFIFYNLSLLFFTKEVSYIYYVGYFIVLIIYYSYYTNMYLLFTDTIYTHLGIYLLSLMTIFILLFTRSFLHIKSYPKIDILFKSLIAIMIVLMIITTKENYPLTLVVITLLTSLVIALGVSYYLLLKGNAQAKYFVLGWSAAIIGYISLAAYNYGFSFIDDKLSLLL